MKRAAPKLALVVLVAVCTATVSGYFMGLRQSARTEPRAASFDPQSVAVVATAASSIRPAHTYEQAGERRHHPNHGWSAQLSDLPDAPDPRTNTVTLTETERAHLLAQRATRRAYNGAPPVVPHHIDQRHAASCLACHGQPTVIGGVSVAQISHPPYQNCLQCHAAGQGPDTRWTQPERPPALALPANTFVGSTPPSGTRRASAEAPPVLPHPVWMRENCFSCHAPGGSSAIKPDHGNRQSCLQCHATDSSLEQRPLVGRPPAPTEMLPPQLLAAIEALP